MREISTCTSIASNFLYHDNLQSFLEMYGIQTGPTLEVEVNLLKQLILTSSIDSLTSFRGYLYSCRPAFNTLHQLAQTALTIAVTSAESKRSFFAPSISRLVSKVEWQKTALSPLATLSKEREIAEKLEYDTIINEFAFADKNR